MLLVRGEQREALQDVQHHLGPEHVLHRPPHVRQRPFRLVLPRAPRTPHLNRHPDRAVAVTLPVRGEGKHIRHEHRRHLPLVNLVHLKRAVEPRHRAARGRLGLADDQRQTVDHKHHVEPLRHRARLKRPLVDHGEPVVRRLDGIHQPHGNMLAIAAKRHRLLAAQPGHEILVGPHQTIARHRQQNGPQRINHLIGAVGLGGDFRV